MKQSRNTAEAFGLAEVHGLCGNECLNGNEPLQQVDLGGELAGGQWGLRGNIFNHFRDSYGIEACGLGVKADFRQQGCHGFLQGQETR